MRYFKFGTGKKIFVILPGLSIQSVMGSADIIAHDYGIIANEFTVYVFDRRTELPDSYCVYDMADDTAKVFEKLGIKDACVFGASQGGMIALTMAIKYPALVRKLMLGSSAARVSKENCEKVEKWIALAQRENGPELYVEQGRDIYPEPVFEKYKRALARLGEGVTKEEFIRFGILAEGTRGFDVTDSLDKISCPVFALGSSDDKVLGGATEELIELFSGKSDFEYFMYSGYGHSAFDTAPDYKEKLLNFCKE